MKKLLYAAYGSNLHPKRLQQRVPSAMWLGSSSVAEFGLRFHKRSVDGSSKCSIVASEGRVHVAVFEFEASARIVLDRAEGLGNGYDEIQLDVPNFGICFTYAAAETHIDGTLRPYCWYRALVTLGCEYNAFPRDYVDVVRETKAHRDPKEDRHAENMNLVAAIANGA